MSEHNPILDESIESIAAPNKRDAVQTIRDIMIDPAESAKDRLKAAELMLAAAKPPTTVVYVSQERETRQAAFRYTRAQLQAAMQRDPIFNLPAPSVPAFPIESIDAEFAPAGELDPLLA